MIIDDLGLPGLPEPLPRPVIDSHTHLDSTQAKSGLPAGEALEIAAGVNVVKAVQIACDLDEIDWTVDFLRTAPRAIGCLALHPNDVARHPEHLDIALDRIRAQRDNPRIRGVGETGLDYFRTPEGEGRAAQQHGFRAHIGLAKELDRTLVIHDRDAHDDVARLLDEECWPERTVFHCFSGDADFARRCLTHDGVWLSFPGTLTYKANVAMREALAIVPQERLLVETDAPYLTPVPARGKGNACYLVPHTVRAMAQVRDEPLEELCDALHRNAEDAFGGAW